MGWMRHRQPDTFGSGTTALCTLLGWLHSMRAAYGSTGGRRGGYVKDPGSEQSENTFTNWRCRRTSVHLLVRREGVTLGAKKYGVCLSQGIPREPGKTESVTSLFLSAKPQSAFLPVHSLSLSVSLHLHGLPKQGPFWEG